jgi:hypothetical protein
MVPNALSIHLDHKERKKERLRVIVRFHCPSCANDRKHDSTLKEEQMQGHKNERAKWSFAY